MRDIRSRKVGPGAIGGQLEVGESKPTERADTDHSNRRNARRGTVITVEDLARVSRLIDEIERESGEVI